MRILVTAIGSFSAMCVINTLRRDGHIVIGCDIYPGNWHAETTRCNKFYQAPFATNEAEYLSFLQEICKQEGIDMILPLTDLEIDVLNRNRHLFESVILAMPSASTLEIARNKHKLSLQFSNDDAVPSIPTYRIGIDRIPDDILPCIAKPFNGRSSEGLMRIYQNAELEIIISNSNYIIQKLVEGPVLTVDYVRQASSGHHFAVPREELLRTKNGAGTTVRIIRDKSLTELVNHIGEVLDINGCVNMEFILNNGKYYLIDINPRFSAGVAFSSVAGYDMVSAHIACHSGGIIPEGVPIREQIITKTYSEEITSFVVR